MRSFFLGVMITSVIWLTCLGIIVVDMRREYIKMQHELSLEPYKLRVELAKCNVVSKYQAWNMVRR